MRERPTGGGGVFGRESSFARRQIEFTQSPLGALRRRRSLAGATFGSSECGSIVFAAVVALIRRRRQPQDGDDVSEAVRASSSSS
jgi:hypothetical protein